MAKNEAVFQITLHPDDRARMEAMVVAAQVLVDSRLQVLEWLGHKPGCLITESDPPSKVCRCGYAELVERLRQTLPPGAGELGLHVGAATEVPDADQGT